MFLLSLPADVYQFGSDLLWLSLLVSKIFQFYQILTSTIPASGVNTHVIIVIFSGVCIFYTAIGGLKAVIWTDALQFIITIATFLAVLILGIKSTGGILVVWQKALDGKRLDIFDFNPDPTKRDSFWIILIGVTVNVMSYTTIDQSFVQKFLSVATFRNSALSMVYYAVGVIIITIISIFIGLIMYVRYSECDLFTSGIIETNEQLVPYYVLDVSRNIPGFSGLFFAGLFSAALSAQSAFLNCLSGTIYEDFVKTFLKPTNHDVSKILKIIALITGIISFSMTFLIEILGNIFPLYISLLGLTCGPVLGIFTSGILFPTTNAKGAFYGGIGALLIAACIVIPIKYYEIQGILKYAPKPLSTNNCSLNQTTFIFDENEAREPHFIFRISFYYFTVIGTASSVIFSLIISYMTNKNDPPVDKALLSPVIHFLLPRDEAVDNKVKYNTIEQALENLTASSDQVVSTDYAE
ncbi:SSF domain containing protein, partial [Asbolus verrucosus]